MKLVLREEIRKLKITEFTSPYEEMIKFVDEQFAVSLSLNIGRRKFINFIFRTHFSKMSSVATV